MLAQKGHSHTFFLALDSVGFLFLSLDAISKPSRGFPGGLAVTNPPANAGDTGLIPDLGRPHMVKKNLVYVLQRLSLCPRAWKSQPLSPHALTPEGWAP